MSDQPDTNSDLIAADAPEPTPALFQAVEQIQTNVDAISDYRPVGGREIQDYLRAKSMGLEGRPSKDQVAAFLASKG